MAIKEAKCMYVKDQILQVKYKDWLIVRLKAIKSGESIFCYLFF